MSAPVKTLCTLFILFGVACGGPAESSPTSDAAADGSFDVVETSSSDAVSDADARGIVCEGSLQDAGFSSLTDLPLAQLCAQSAVASDNPGGLVLETPTSCAGLIFVSSATGIDCAAFWLFDASTGALQADGSICNGSYISCVGAAPGFAFPDQCFVPYGWPGSGKQLCPDAGG
jgi:hypothetical protein